MPTYTFATGVPNITPAVYDVNDTETDLNTTPTATASNGVLSLVLDAGDYYAEWTAQGDTHRTGGAVVARDPDTYQDADAPSGSSLLPVDARVRTITQGVDGTVDSATTTVVHWDGAAASMLAYIDAADPATGFEFDSGNLYVPADAPFIVRVQVVVSCTTLTSALVGCPDGLFVDVPLHIKDNGNGTLTARGLFTCAVPEGWASGPAGGAKIAITLAGTGITSYSPNLVVWSQGS